jgi:hypothetical protein
VTPAVLKEIIEYTKGKDTPEGDIAWMGVKP